MYGSLKYHFKVGNKAPGSLSSFIYTRWCLRGHHYLNERLTGEQQDWDAAAGADDLQHRPSDACWTLSHVGQIQKQTHEPHIREESKKSRYLHQKGQHIHKCQDPHECDNGLLRENVHFLDIANTEVVFVRFFPAIFTLFMCSLKQIKHFSPLEVNFDERFSPTETCYIYYQIEQVCVCRWTSMNAIQRLI